MHSYSTIHTSLPLTTVLSLATSAPTFTRTNPFRLWRFQFSDVNSRFVSSHPQTPRSRPLDLTKPPAYIVDRRNKELVSASVEITAFAS